MNFTVSENKDKDTYIEFRTQTADEEAWRAKMTPGPNEKLVLQDIDNRTFRLALVIDEQDGDKRTGNLSLAELKDEAVAMNIAVPKQAKAHQIRKLIDDKKARAAEQQA